VTRGICTTKNRFTRSRFSIEKQKPNSIQELETFGLHRKSKSQRICWQKYWLFFDSHGYERKQILIRNSFFGLVPTPAKHVLLVHINMSQRLNIHQGLKIRYIFTYKQSNLQTVNVEHRELGWQPHYLWSVRWWLRLWFEPRRCTKKVCVFFKNWHVLKIASTFKTHVRSFCKNQNKLCSINLIISPCHE